MQSDFIKSSNGSKQALINFSHDKTYRVTIYKVHKVIDGQTYESIDSKIGFKNYQSAEKWAKNKIA
jgi:hypothetical protein